MEKIEIRCEVNGEVSLLDPSTPAFIEIVRRGQSGTPESIDYSPEYGSPLAEVLKGYSRNYHDGWMQFLYVWDPVTETYWLSDTVG